MGTWSIENIKRGLPDGQFKLITGNGIILAFAGATVYKTTDEGLTWTSSSIGYGMVDGLYANNLFVCSIYNTTTLHSSIITSPDGENWTIRNTPNTYLTGYPVSLAYGLGRFVGVKNGTKFLTSLDGVTWTEITVANLDWRAIGFGNGNFVAFGYAGEVRYSSDGTNFYNNAGTVTTGISWKKIIYANGRYVGIGTGNKIASSIYHNGGWATYNAPVSANWSTLAHNGTVFVSTNNNTSNNIMQSSDGVTWTYANAISGLGLYGLIYKDGYFFTAGTNEADPYKLYKSINGFGWVGITISFHQGLLFNKNQDVYLCGYFAFAKFLSLLNWDYVPRNGTNAPVTYIGAVYHIDLYIIVSQFGTNRLSYSYDGYNWTGIYFGASLQFQYIASNGQAVVASDLTGTTPSLHYSASGTAWTNVTPSPFNRLYSAIVWTGQVFLTTSLTHIYQSTDGITWTSHTSAFLSVASMRSIAMTGNVCVIVSNSKIYHSADLMNWTQVYSGISIDKVYFDEVGFWACGGSSKVLYSADGVTWAELETGLSSSYINVCHGVIAGQKRIFFSNSTGLQMVTIDLDTVSNVGNVYYHNGSDWVLAKTLVYLNGTWTEVNLLHYDGNIWK